MEQAVEVDPLDLDPRERAASSRHEQMGYDPEDDDVVISDTLDDEPEVVEEESKTVEVKINGETLFVDREKIDKAGGIDIYQKRRGAEEGLQSLSNQRKMFKQEQNEFALQQALFAEGQRLSTQDGIKKETNVPPNIGERKELVKQYHQAMYDGDDEKANELFLELNQGMQAPQVVTPKINEELIVEKAATRTRQRIAQELRAEEQQKANASFADDHPIVAGDTKLFDMASQETVNLQVQHPDWSPAKVISEAARTVEKWYEGVSGGNTTADDKLADKRTISAVKTASGRSTPPPPIKHETNSDYITKLRKQRGLEI